MSLTSADKKEIEGIVRKEIKDFLGSNTLKQFEKNMIDNVKKEMRKGELRGDITEFISKSFYEFYYLMWRQKGTWENTIKNIKL
jgi:hypothetical protein